MKVREMLDMLNDYDPDSDVILVLQENWPLEHHIFRVVQRSEVFDGDEDEENYGSGKDPSDVLIVEGEQIGYGSKNAWYE